MLIKGVAYLAACYLLGQLIGEGFGKLLHINANVGGVGFAMILFIVIQNELRKNGLFGEDMEGGVRFWSKMYIPVIVAMSACQNVRGALSSGMVSLLAGTIPVVISLIAMPYISKLSKPQA